jgi:dipeptidyl-peptidase-3
MAAAHKAVGELLAEIMRVKGTGDYEAGRRLVLDYGVRFDPGLRDEAAARIDRLDIPRQRAYIMPELDLVANRMGGVKDVQIRHPMDFEGQMIRFARKG